MSDTQNNITMYYRNLFKVASRQIFHTIIDYGLKHHDPPFQDS